MFRHLNIGDGLSSNNVKAVLEDSYGFLWVGTMSGLNRYDGYGFKKYYNDSFNDICTLQEDGLGNIWIGNGFGYIVYCREKDNFITDIPNFLKKYDISVDGEFQIYVDKAHDLWVLNQDHIYFYDTHKRSVKTFMANSTIIKSCVDLTANDRCLFLSLKSGELWQFCKDDAVLTNIESPWKDDVRYDRVYVDNQQSLWAFSGQTDSVYCKKKSSSRWEVFTLSSKIKIKNHGVHSILDDGKGHIWIGTDHKGLFIYEKSSETFENVLFTEEDNSSSIASNNIACLYQDRNGTIWIGHNKVGLSYFHDSFCRFITMKYPQCSDITSMMEDKQGNLWLGTDGNGLFVKEKDGNLRKFPIFDSAIIALLEDNKGRVWISSYLNGLFCFENGRLDEFSSTKLVSNTIWGLQEDRYGKIWLASIEALQYLDPKNGKISFLLNSDGEYIHPLKMYYDGGDKLYVGTLYGLYIIDIVTGKQSQYLGNKKGTQTFMNSYISDVYKNSDNLLFLAHNSGLTIWDLNIDSLYYINEKSGLCNNVIQAIAEDADHRIWITTSNGISVLSIKRQGNNNFEYLIKNYSVRDGLTNGSFNGNSICKLKNGNILFGGIDGCVSVNPNKISEQIQQKHKVLFTNLYLGNNVIHIDSLYNGRKILNKSIEQTSSLVLSHDDQFIPLEFMVGDLLNANNISYAYMLRGLNKQWLFTRANKVTFSSLPPGEYDLLIKARNADGEWYDELTMLNITIIPPFYKTLWAYLFYISFILVLIVYLIWRLRKQHNSKLEQHRLKLEYQQKIYIADMKLRFFTNISHDLRTPLTLIITPLQIMLNEISDKAVHKKLTVIYQNAQHLLELINSLLDFRKLDVGAEMLRCKQGDIIFFVKEICTPFYDYAIDRNIHFSFFSETQTFQMTFDAKKKKKIVINLLSNAFKYTPELGCVSVEIYLEGVMLCIKVADTGIGISECEKKHIFERFYQVENQEGTGGGIGLHIVKEYVQLHKGSISVLDNIPCGSIFIVRLPISVVEDSKKIDILTSGESENTTEDHITRPILLLVDDNKDFCTFLADSLASEYSVKIANNGQEALKILYNCDIDIIVSDVMMPVMNGIELCNEIKNNIHLSHIPIILLTARTTEESQLEGLESGADNYITKPFTLELLKLRISKFIEWTKHCHYTFKEKMDISPDEITITSLDEQLIKKALEIVEENLTNPNFSVELLGQNLGLSRSHLYKKLMFITGKGPAEFIRIIRLKRGRQLLEKSQMQISEVAYAVGFNSPKRFTQNFKNEFGMSPSEYLKGLKCS